MKGKFGLFASIKNIDDMIHIYRKISTTLQAKGYSHYKSWIVDEYPYTKARLKQADDTIVTNTNRQLRNIIFAVAEFSTKSRTVFFQTIMALENSIPVLCLVQKHSKQNINRYLKPYRKDLLTIKTYKSVSDIEDILVEYEETIDPPKKRFNIMLNTRTLKEMEQLAKTLEISKAELIRGLIHKEFETVFSEEIN